MTKLLLVIDPQNDFISGSLPVPGAIPAMDELAAHVAKEVYDHKVVTLDYHPENHCSFIDNGGQWPAHCVSESPGAEIYPPLGHALKSSAGSLHILTKGSHPQKEEYSILQNKTSAAILVPLLKEADRVDVCGLAGDICVLNTLKDAIDLCGPDKFHVLECFAPSLDGGTALAEYVKDLEKCGRS